VVEITLSSNSIFIACTTGIWRWLNSTKNGKRPKYGAPVGFQGLAIAILGAIGECAVAKWANKYWDGDIGNYDADDVQGLQVRTVDSNSKRLIIHEEDKDEQPYILVYVDPPNVMIKGWKFGNEGKNSKYWKDPSGKNRFAYFVDDADLVDMKHLPVTAQYK